MVMLYWGMTWLDRHFSRSERPVIVAKITLMKDCRFAPGETPPAETTQLEKGRQLRLEKGLLQITYDTGAEVLIAGPATYKIDSDNSGSLSLGKLTAQVETIEAEGFTIITPNARFVDLGTEFGVKVDEQGRDEAHVFKGRVNAETKLSGGGWSAPVALVQGQAFVWKGFQFTVQVGPARRFPLAHRCGTETGRRFRALVGVQQRTAKTPGFSGLLRFPEGRKEPRCTRQ